VGIKDYTYTCIRLTTKTYKMKDQRIQLTDSIMDITIKMCEGNPGAMTFIMGAFKESEEIDPDGMGNLGFILNADRCGIYGTDLYVLWSDLCDRNMTLSIALLRATQLGIISDELLADACNRQDYSGKDIIAVQEVYEKVCEQLPNFQRI